jgi:hypothetical protein
METERLYFYNVSRAGKWSLDASCSVRVPYHTVREGKAFKETASIAKQALPMRTKALLNSILVTLELKIPFALVIHYHQSELNIKVMLP